MMKRATIFEMVMAASLCVAMNIFTYFTNFLQYYMTGIVGIGTVLAGSFVTIFRLWDAVTDIGVGISVDRTNSRFGKFRPWILAGMVLNVVFSGLLLFLPYHLPENVPLRMAVYIVCYMVCVVGATCLNPATRSTAQVLTDDPKQRAMIGMIRGVMLQIFYAIMPIIVFSHIIPVTKGFNIEFFKRFWMVFAGATVIFCITGIIGLSGKDPKENAQNTILKPEEKINFREMWDVIKHNRPLQMLILSAGSDKLATVCQNNATIVVILYAIVAGNAELNSGANKYTMIPCILMLILGLGGIGRKFGAKKTMLFGSLGGIVVCTLSILLWIFGDPKTFSFPGIEGFNGWTGFTICFLILWCLYKGFTMVTSNVTNPMIADVIDYEQYRSGRYMPGLVGALFSFADKVISSIGPTLVSLLIAGIGFHNDLPTLDTPFSNKLFAVGLFGMYGMVIIGLIINLIAMKFYDLDPEKMEMIRKELAKRKGEEKMAETERK